MDKKEQIRKRLREFLAPGQQTILATVTSVDEGEMTCVLDDDSNPIYDVNLRPVLNGKESITIIPKVGSWVMAARIEQDEDWMVFAYDEIDKCRIKVGDLLFEMKDGKFLLQSGTENLGKCIDDLIIQIQAIYAPKNTAAITLIQTRLKQLLSGT